MSDLNRYDKSKIKDFDTDGINLTEGMYGRWLHYYLVTKNDFAKMNVFYSFFSNMGKLGIKTNGGKLMQFVTKLHLVLDFLGIMYIFGDKQFLAPANSRNPFYYFYAENTSLPRIIEELEKLDTRELEERFDPEELWVYRVYPDWIWERDKRESLFERLMSDYRDLLEFYKSARDLDANVCIECCGDKRWCFYNMPLFCRLDDLKQCADGSIWDEEKAGQAMEIWKVWAYAKKIWKTGRYPEKI